MNWWKRLIRGRQLDKQIADELRFHFDCQVTDNMRAGMSETEARRRAQQSLGGLMQVGEECRQARGTTWLESTLQDLRFAFRTLWKRPAFALTAVITLALGIGATVGLYGMISYMVIKRTHEIGIRMALGARRYQVIRLVMREAGLATVIGVGVGLLISLAATRSAASLLFGLKPNDPLTLAGAAILLALVAAVASWLPALHASRVDPMSALRDE